MANSSSEQYLDADLREQINTWCGVHGLMYSDGGEKWNAAPLSLIPLPYPQDSFSYLRDLQWIWNILMDRISRNRIFLLKELSSVAESDREFSGRLLALYSQLPVKKVQSSWSLGIFRSDYMLHHTISSRFDREKDHFIPLQVEINTIASGLGCLTTKSNTFLKEFLLRNEYHPQVQKMFSQQSENIHASESDDIKMFKNIHEIANAIELSPSSSRIALAMAQAHSVYLRNLHDVTSDSEKTNSVINNVNDKVRILVVVQPNERNVGDQRALEQELWSTHGIRCEFATFAELVPPHLFMSQPTSQADNDTIFNHPGALFFKRHSHSPCYEISLVYFRAGYTPTDYVHQPVVLSAADLSDQSRFVDVPDSDDSSLKAIFLEAMQNSSWAVRYLIEQSRAIKCPSLGLHLAGVKAIQASLTRPKVLEELFSSGLEPSVAVPLSKIAVMSSPENSTTNKRESTVSDDVLRFPAITEDRSKDFEINPKIVSEKTFNYHDSYESDIEAANSKLIEEWCKKLRKCFAEQYLLRRLPPIESRPFGLVDPTNNDSNSNEIGMTAAIANAIQSRGKDWVLKPQREGGGNNLYDEDLALFLERNMESDNIEGYVLMRRFQPPVQHHSYFYKFGHVSHGASISELGIFGSYLGHGSSTLDEPDTEINGGYLGYLLRTKLATVNEGGVATGFSALNSLYLVENLSM